MQSVFCSAKFNGDISKWNTSNVKNMFHMFSSATFDGDISEWNVSKVKDISYMFYASNFTGNISKWKPYELNDFDWTFRDSKLNEPYWYTHYNKDERKKAIDAYHLSEELNKELIDTNKAEKKLKI
jgi:surface protein